jgi:hypothetical protein
MSEMNHHQRWIDLYKIGCFSCIVFVTSIAIAVIAYFIWPYTPGFTSVENIFILLQANRMGGLVSLDFLMVILMPIMILPILALYASLKTVNESYAMIALVLGLIGNTTIFAGRPVAEMAYLSDQFAAATSEVTKSQYLAAGEALHALFNGTAWMSSMFLIGISGSINSLLMLRSKVFTRATALVGLVVSIAGLGFLLPVIGPILSLAATIGGVIWYLQIARTFYQLGWTPSKFSP